MKSLALTILTLLTAFLPHPASAQNLAVKAGRLYTMAGDGVITNGVVLISDGKIREAGPASRVRIPDGWTVLEAAAVTPGFVDAHATVGMSGQYNVPGDQDINESTETNTAELRALDGYLPTEPLVQYVREHGVTTVHVCPGPQNPIAGQSAVFKTAGNTVTEALIQSPAAMLFTLGELPKTQGKAPTTRMATASIIRKALEEARQYAQQEAETDPDKQPKKDLRKAALAQVVRGDIPAMITCHRSDDIMTALRLAEEFGLRLILDGATEGYLLRDRITAAGVPVVAAPVMLRPESIETLNSTFESPALLQQQGILFAIQSGFEGYVPKTRVIPFEAAMAMANGLPEEAALAAITINPARILGLDHRVGSLEPGKDADLALFDGDPLEYLTHVTAVIINGVKVFERTE